MISLGIDASPRSTGLSLISEDESSVKNIVPKKLYEGERLDFIYNSALDFISDNDIDLCVMEGPAYFATTKAFSMGEVYGIFKLAIKLEIGCPLIVLSPKELKKYLCGRGDATKFAMVTQAQKLGCPSSQEDICDSWAAALLGYDVLTDSNTPNTRASKEITSRYRKMLKG